MSPAVASKPVLNNRPHKGPRLPLARQRRARETAGVVGLGITTKVGWTCSPVMAEPCVTRIGVERSPKSC